MTIAQKDVPSIPPVAPRVVSPSHSEKDSFSVPGRIGPRVRGYGVLKYFGSR